MAVKLALIRRKSSELSKDGVFDIKQACNHECHLHRTSVYILQSASFDLDNSMQSLTHAHLRN